MTFSNQETKDLAYKIKTASNAVSIAEIFAGFFVGGLPGAAVGLLAVAVTQVVGSQMVTDLEYYNRGRGVVVYVSNWNPLRIWDVPSR